MSDEKATYEDGFEDGWRSLRPITVLPTYCPKVRKPGQTDYQAGYAHGVEAAQERLRKK